MYYNPANEVYLNQARQSQQQWLPFPPQSQPPQPQQPQLISRFVSSENEAKTVLIDPLSINLFVDIANGKIYVKKMGDNGLYEFYVYTQEEAPADPLSQIDLRLTKIENFIGGLYDKSISNDAGSKQSTANAQPAVTEQNESNGPAESAGIPENAGNDKWKKRN